MNITIRKAKGEDFETIYQFLCELQSRVFEYELIEVLYNKNISNPEFHYLVALDGDDIIGYLSCHTQTLLHHAGKVAEIQEMFVATEYRGKGIGKLMMCEIKKQVQESGVLQLEVTTRAIREKAIQFYLRESFEDSHKKLVYYFKNSTSV